MRIAKGEPITVIIVLGRWATRGTVTSTQPY